MTTEGLLPLFYEQGPGERSEGQENDLAAMLNCGDTALQDDVFLSELLASQDNDLDFLSLLKPTNEEQAVTENGLFAVNSFNPASTTATAAAAPQFNPDPTSAAFLANSPIGSDGYSSDASYMNQLNPSPLSYTSHHTSEHSPSHSPRVSSTLPDIDIDPALGPLLQPHTTSALSSDVMIDLDLMPHDSPLSTDDVTGSRHGSASEAQAGDGGSSLKASTVYLTEEEKRLLAEEGIVLPTDMPLTKAEQKHLKRIRRKIKNKISAQESRKRKKEYVEGLEERVKKCTDVNRKLQTQVSSLTSENKSLLSQLKRLQTIVKQYNPSKFQAGSVLMVVVLCFSLFAIPRYNSTFSGGRDPSAVGYQSLKVHSRTLLFAETDEFGNVVDAETGAIISSAGGRTPPFPPPWVQQSPAINFMEPSSLTINAEL